MLRLCLIVTALVLALPAAGQAQSWYDQRDRPGDFRCDAYWDRGRDDCDAAWRTRHLEPRHGRGRHDYGYPRYVEPRPYAPPPVYREPERIAWCARRFRSYDPHTGYYLGYSGRWNFCG